MKKEEKTLLPGAHPLPTPTLGFPHSSHPPCQSERPSPTH